MNLEIKAQLVRNGIKVKDVAREANVAPVTVSVVLNGHRKSRNIQDTIARLLGKTYRQLWGKTA